MKMKSKEKKAYKDFQDRVAMLGKPRKLTWQVVFLYSFLKLRRRNRGR